MVQNRFSSRQKHCCHSLAAASALIVASLAQTALAAEPTVDDVKAAEADFDAGREAYKAGDYVEAAEHFESADGHAPNEKVLELAISARDKAGNKDRAATLAQLGLETYPNSERLKKIAAPLVDSAHAELLQITIECSEACSLLDGTRIVHGPPAERWIIFLTPGDHTIRAGWSGERTLSQNVTGNAGDTAQLTFTAPPVPKSGAASAQASTNGADTGVRSSTRVLPPLYTYIGAGATAVLGGVTIWSGIDTLNNPGADKVRTACRNNQPSCDTLYNQGRDAQTRTNILIAATSVVGAATAVVGLFFTDWSGKKKTEESVSVVPWVSYDGGPAAGAMGRF
ncbi:MAG TPA: hypothetical protein VHC69_28610 [Polyangiaceae bacterium]|nr:hypothetical protein [Polyangiaceae bacterium]